MRKPVLNFAILTLLILVGVLVNPSSWGNWESFVFKAFVLAGIGVVLYRLWDGWNDAPDEVDELSDEEDQKETERPVFIENKASLLNKTLHQNGEILDFLRKQFFVIWNLILPHNGYLLLMTPDQEMVVLHKKVRDDLEFQKIRLPIPVLALIDNAKGFLLENHVENGATLLPFYNRDEYVPHSFLGFRSEIDRALHLYWIFDAETFDVFNDEDRSVLHRINEATVSYVNKVLTSEALADEKRQLTRSLMLSRDLNATRNVSTAVDLFTDFLAEEFQARTLTVAFRKDFRIEEKKGVVFAAIGQHEPVKPGYEFPLEEGLNGWVILKDRPYLLDDIDKGDYFIPRFSRAEKTNYGLRAFLSVPLHFNDQSVGMVTLEDSKANKFSIADKERLVRYCELFSVALNRLIQEKQIGG